MRIIRYTTVVAATATVAALLAASPARAWDAGVNLRTGDQVCTDRTQTPTGVRAHGHVIRGAGIVSILASDSPTGPETVVWSSAEVRVDFSHYHYASGYFRSCVTITEHGTLTYTRFAQERIGTGAVGDIGPHTASLSPGARACGDWGLGPVRLEGSATGIAQWSIDAHDQDYGFVGTVFSVDGESVDTAFVPGPELSLLEMCVRNLGSQPISASFELS